MEAINNHTLHNGENSAIHPRGGQSPVTVAVKPDHSKVVPFTSRLVDSLTYAFFLGLGTVVWFYYFSRFLIRNRQRLNVHSLNRIIHILGVVLCLLGIYLIYAAIRMFQNPSVGFDSLL